MEEEKRNPRNERRENIRRVVAYLVTHPDTHLRQIARDLNMSPSRIHRTLQYLGDFIITRSVNDELQATSNQPLPQLPTYIRLRPGTTYEGIMRFLGIKEKLDRLRKLH